MVDGKKPIPRPGELGDTPEDLNIFFRTYMPQFLQTLPKKPIDVLLRDLGEIFILAPQQVVPVNAKPFKSSVLKFKIPAGTLSFIDIISFAVAPNHAAIVTDISESLETIGAYDDCTIRLFWRSESDQWWIPKEPEIISTKITLFSFEVITIQATNTNLIVDHYLDAELVGYVFPVNSSLKDQTGLRVNTGQNV
jgi:hypothetical protein